MTEQQLDKLFWDIIKNDQPYQKFVSVFSELDDVERFRFHIYFFEQLHTDDYQKWIEFILNDNVRYLPIDDEPDKNERLACEIFADRVFAEIQMIKTSLQFHNDLLKKAGLLDKLEEQVDRASQEKLKWNGLKEELFFVFYQLTKLKSPVSGEPYLPEKNTSLAKFIKLNFIGFERTTEDSLRKYFSYTDHAKVPKSRALDFRDTVRTEILKDDLAL